MDDQTPSFYEWSDGTKQWTLHCCVHRQDGPAIEYPDGHVGWYLNGIEYTFDLFLELTTCSPETKCMLKLIYG